MDKSYEDRHLTRGDGEVEIHAIQTMDELSPLIFADAERYNLDDFNNGIKLEVAYSTPYTTRPRILIVKTGYYFSVLNDKQSVEDSIKALVPIKQLRNAEAQRKFIAKATPEARVAITARAVMAMKKTRVIRLDKGIKSRELYLDDEEWKQVKEFVEQMRKKGR